MSELFAAELYIRKSWKEIWVCLNNAISLRVFYEHDEKREAKFVKHIIPDKLFIQI